MSDPHSPADAVAAAEEEPQTPPWLPALGAVLFIGAAMVWAGISAASHGARESAEPATSAAVATSTAVAVAPLPPRPVPPPPMPPPAAAPPSTAMAAAQPSVRAGAALSAGAAGQGRPKALPRKPGGTQR